MGSQFSRWIFGAMLLAAPIRADDLHTRCQKLALRLGRQNITLRRNQVLQQQQWLATAYQNLQERFRTSSEIHFLTKYSAHIETVRSEFNAMNQESGLVAAIRLHFDKISLSSPNRYAVPYLEFEHHPAHQSPLPVTLIGQRLLDLIDFPSRRLSVVYDPLAFFVTKAQGLYSDEQKLGRQHVFINVSDIFSVEHEPIVIRHETIHMKGQDLLHRGQTIPLHHTRIDPRYHHIDHFYSKDLRSHTRQGLILDELFAYEDSLRSSLYNLGVSIRNHSYIDALESLREFERHFHSLDNIYLDASVAFSLSSANLLDMATKAFLEQSNLGYINYVVPYDYDGNPLVPRGSHSSHAELKYPTSPLNIPLLDKLNLRLTPQNRKGNRRIPISKSQRADLRQKILAMQTQMEQRYEWLTPLHQILSEFQKERQNAEASLQSMAIWYEKFYRVLNSTP